jgi:hypothetical protein
MLAMGAGARERVRRAHAELAEIAAEHRVLARAGDAARSGAASEGAAAAARRRKRLERTLAVEA